MTDNGHLEFEGQPVHASTTNVKGTITAPMRLHHGQTVHLVAEAKVGDVRFPQKKGIVDRVHVLSIERGQAVDPETAQDLLDDNEERGTGQMHLLSFEGEVRRAARYAVNERFRAIKLGHDDAEHDVHDLPALASLVESFATDAATRDADKLGPEAYFVATEDDLTKAAGLCLAAITWVRRRKAEHDEEQRRIEAEAVAERLAQQAKAMAESSDENTDKRERRGLTDEDEQQEDEL